MSPVVIAALAIGAAFLIATLLMSGRRLFAAAGEGRAPFGRWRWSPSPLALLLLPLLGLLLWRIMPELLFIPIILPIFWWRRRIPAPSFVRRRTGEKAREDGTIEGQYRRLDD